MIPLCYGGLLVSLPALVAWQDAELPGLVEPTWRVVSPSRLRSGARSAQKCGYHFLRAPCRLLHVPSTCCERLALTVHRIF